MPFLEHRRLLADFTFLSDSGTFQFRLPRQGLISKLEIFLNITNGATHNQTETVYDAIDRVEIIANGSRVLYSLTGQQARCWSHLFLKKRPAWVNDQTPSVAQRAHILIPFGYPLSNPTQYLDCGMYQDLELRITYSPTIAATQFATGTCILAVYADMWVMGAPAAFGGFLRLTEQTYFTTLASGDEMYDLPIGNPYLAVGLYVYEAGVSPEANITDFTIEVDDGSWVPVVGEFEDLGALFTEQLGINTDEWGIAYMSNTDAIESYEGTLGEMMKDRIQSLTIGVTDQLHDIFSGYAGGQATLQTLARDAASVAADAADTTDGPIKWSARPKFGGMGNFLPVPLGIQDPTFALMSGNYGRVRAKMTQGNAGAEARLSLLELVTS